MESAWQQEDYYSVVPPKAERRRARRKAATLSCAVGSVGDAPAQASGRGRPKSIAASLFGWISDGSVAAT